MGATSSFETSVGMPEVSIPYGRIAYPGIGYSMGNRRMVVTAMDPITYVNTVGPRERWDPVQGVGTNRKEDKAHRDGIAAYIQDNPEYVLNAILVYADPSDAEFIPRDPRESIGPGTLFMRPGAKFKVGDGGHRTSAYGDVIQAHSHGDDVLQRLQNTGQPIIVVLDDNQARRAQDFTDLQKNAKPLNASIAQSMDRRQAVNRLLIERCIKVGDLPLLNGDRVEFLSDSPGKLSAKMMGFKTVRYATGLLLVGTGQRSVKGWEDAVSVEIARDEEAALRRIRAFWTGIGAFPPVEAALAADSGIAMLRENTWLTSPNVLYAIAAATHELTSRGHSLDDALSALGRLDYSRQGTTLHGTLVEPPATCDDRPKARTGRDAWEGASHELTRLAEQMLREAGSHSTMT